MPSARRAIAALAATALALTACNGGEPAAENTSTASGTSAPSTVAPPTTDEVQHLYLTDPLSWLNPADRSLPPDKLEPVLAYIRAEQAWLRAGMVPVNPDSPDLPATTGGLILDNVRNQLRESAESGYVNGPPKLFKLLPKRFLVEDTRVLLDVCLTSQVPIVNVRTGQTVDDKLWSVDTAVELQRRDANWIVVALESLSEERDGDSCGQ